MIFFICPAGVRPVIVLCIEPLADRFQDLAELEEDLEWVLDGKEFENPICQGRQAWELNELFEVV
jgi:hypothetical protein